MSKIQTEKVTFIDPMSDFGFKKIFAEEPNKDLLISFLNEVFRGRKQIMDLVYNKNEHLGDNRREGGAIFDLTCTGADGGKFIIEVQRARQDNFKKRALFYTSRLISNQAPKGARATWDYDIPEVYLVALLDGFSLSDTPVTEYLHDICLCNRDTGDVFYAGFGYVYIELLKFEKQEDELMSDLDRWLHVLKNMNKMSKIPVYLRKPIFERVFNIASYSNLTKEEKMLYDNSLKRKWDNKSITDTAFREGKQEGIQQGIQQGKREGERKKAIAIALKFKKMGIAVEDIAKGTGLSVEEIEEL